MYVKKTLIEKELKWIRELKPKHPIASANLALGKLSTLYMLEIIDDKTYEELYDRTREIIEKIRERYEREDTSAFDIESSYPGTGGFDNGID